MRRLLLCLAVLVLLTCSAAAYEIPEDFSDQSLDEIVTEFREAYGLTERNYAISYYNTVTGESYAWNDTWFSIAASTYKLPLNMYFYEMQQAGEISGDTIISWTGQTLDYIHEQSIVNSNNELSEALMFYWGDHVTYKQNMRKYFTMTDEEIHPSYWQANWYCVRMMMDCLKYLYDHQDSFQELIGYMKQAMPGEYFKAGVTEYEVAHKYGSVQCYDNDVAIIYTPQPILLAVYSLDGETGGAEICAQSARLMVAYTLWQDARTPDAPEEPEEPAHQIVELPIEEVEPMHEATPETAPEPAPLPPAPEPEPVPLPTSPPEAPVQTAAEPFPWWLLGVGAVLLLALIRLLIRKR